VALAVDDEGNVLVAFHRLAEGVNIDDVPLPLSLVAWWHAGRLLLVFNQHRRQWELPGGMIDPGETPQRAAVRELREETGYQVDRLVLAGYARFALGVEQRPEYAAVFTADAIPRGDNFAPNEEVGAMCWWDEAQPLAARVQMLDVLLGRLVRPHGRRETGTPSDAPGRP
jgi:8-oxo-dGTP diphosphatase